jgi:hypothetical protein
LLREKPRSKNPGVEPGGAKRPLHQATEKAGLMPAFFVLTDSNSHYGISNKINMIKIGILHLLRYLPQIMSI